LIPVSSGKFLAGEDIQLIYQYIPPPIPGDPSLRRSSFVALGYGDYSSYGAIEIAPVTDEPTQPIVISFGGNQEAFVADSDITIKGLAGFIAITTQSTIFPPGPEPARRINFCLFVAADSNNRNTFTYLPGSKINVTMTTFVPGYVEVFHNSLNINITAGTRVMYMVYATLDITDPNVLAQITYGGCTMSGGIRLII
jgi:hypothetical protein